MKLLRPTYQRNGFCLWLKRLEFYGGKNTPEQIQQDAADLCGAICRDTDALRANLSSRGYDSKLVDETIQKIVERNRETGVIKK